MTQCVGSRSVWNLENLAQSRIARPSQVDMTSTLKPLSGPQDTHGARNTTTLNGPELRPEVYVPDASSDAFCKEAAIAEKAIDGFSLPGTTNSAEHNDVLKLGVALLEASMGEGREALKMAALQVLQMARAERAQMA